MLKNYFKTALRVLFKNKFFSLINIFGLAVSMSVCLIIMLFIMQHKSYDTFHEKSERLYRIYSDYKASINSSSQLYATSPIMLGRILEDEYTGVEEALTLRQFGSMVRFNDTEARLSGAYASPAYFSLFDFELQEGDVLTALENPYSLILSQEAATRFFGDRSAVGEAIVIDSVAHTVTGILNDHPGPSNFQFEALISYSTLETEAFQPLFESWHNTVRSTYTVVLLDEGAKPEEVSAQFADVIERHFPSHETSWLAGLHIDAVKDINLGTMMGNQMSRVMPAFIAYFLMAIGGIVMLAACFNYIGLSIARSLTRAKEVGLRKVTGAARGQVMLQFIFEAVTVSLAALGIALLFVVWLVPQFNSLWFVSFSGTLISVNLLRDVNTYMVFILFSVCIGVLAGMYPSIYLSRFMPAHVLKGQVKGGRTSRMWFRKSLVVLQVVFSLIFIISSLVIYRQFNHMAVANYGFESDNIVNVRLMDVDYDVFKAEMEKYPEVSQVSAISVLPIAEGRRDIWMKTDEMDEPVKGYSVSIDYELIDNFGLTILAGRNVSPEFAADTDNSVLLNERAARLLNLNSYEEALGQKVTLFDDWEVQIVGVVKDYYTREGLGGIDPLVFSYSPDEFAYANVKAIPGGVEDVLAHIEEAWAPLSDRKADVQLFTTQIRQTPNMMFLGDMIALIGIITLIAVAIACLGLLGMATFIVERRTKEVGIRKVLGADTSQVVYLLSKEFIQLSGLAVLIAVPLVWLLSSQWLQLFALRTELSLPIFVIGISVMAGLLFLTIGSQTIRAALKNPVETIKYE